MSTEEYTRKIESTRKALVTLKKDIKYRDEAVIRNEPTYTLDAEIKGQFIQIEEELQGLEIMYQNTEKKAKEMNLLQRDLDKRKQALDVNIQERNQLKRMYDESLARRVPNTRAAQEAENKEKFQQQYQGQQLSKEQLMVLKQQHEDKQEEAIDQLLGTVRQMKAGQGEIRKELSEHDGLLDILSSGMDENIENMSKVKRNMMKLLESSSYFCLILVIILEIVGIVCNLALWPKH